MTISLPGTLKIGPFEWKIVQLDTTLIDEDGETEIRGLCSPWKLEISVVTKDQTDRQIIATLLHEVLHAVWHVRSLPKKVSEERAVLHFELALLELFQDNPAFLKLINLACKPTTKTKRTNNG